MKTSMLLAIAAAQAAAAAAAGTSIILESFDNPKHQWQSHNDPVMGGRSTSTTNIASNTLIFDGECAIVPFLHAPGFIKAESRDSVKYPDISSCNALVVRAKSTTPNYAGYRLSFGNKHAAGNGYYARGYKSNFHATATMSDIELPFHGFSDYWNDASGDQIKTCAENNIYCPDKTTLEDIGSLKIWAEGVAGKVHLEIASISATGCGSGGKNIVQLAAGTKDLSTLVAALKVGKLVTALEGKGPFTVFAPTNEAFGKLPAATIQSLLDPKNIKQLDAILEYHVVAGAAVYSKDLKAEQHVKTLQGETLLVEKHFSGVYINRKAKVTTADVAASNGVVHIINTVLVPPSVSAPKTSKNIVQLAAGTKDLSTLVAALKAGKLVTALEGKGPFTVFAPTNEAFAKLPAATLQSLLDPKNIKQLDAILEYHVVAGAAVYSKSLKSSQHVKTLQGATLLVEKHWSGVYINRKAKVTTADVAASNGVVHIINTVLLPPHIDSDKCIVKVPRAQQPEYAFEFAALDTDHDGYLHPSEFKNEGEKLAGRFDNYRKRGHSWGRTWGGRNLRGSRNSVNSWLENLRRKWKEKSDAMRAQRVFNKFDENHSHSISLCEFENAMYKEKLEDDKFGGNKDGPVIVHG